MPGACRRHIYGEVGEGREHAGAYKLGMYKQKMEQMIGGVGSMQATKIGVKIDNTSSNILNITT